MQIQANVKHNLYKIFIILSITMLISTRSFAFGGQSIYGGYGIEISNDGKKIRLLLKTNPPWISDWLDLKNGGEVVLNAGGKDEYKIRIFNRNIELSYTVPSTFSQTNNPASLCDGGKAEEVIYYNGELAQYDYIDIDGNGNMRWCSVYVRGGGTRCGNWVSFDKNYVCQSCPQGYTYNANRNICEAEPIYNYSCPYAGQTCIEQSKGVAYCSPYNCNSTSIGTWCSTGNINTTNMTANSIGMWQCSYDSTWYIDEVSCKTGCNYFQCSYNNNWYQGDKSVCEVNCREKGQCTELNQ